jgi:hypothetical protein
MSTSGKQDVTFIKCINSLRFFISPLLLAGRLSRHGLLNLVRMYKVKCTNLKNCMGCSLTEIFSPTLYF